MAKYRSKPVIKEAIQWNGTYSHALEIGKLFPELKTARRTFDPILDKCYSWTIATLEGEHVVSSGDYIIKGLVGEFYPCKPDVFEKSYELVGGDMVYEAVCPHCKLMVCQCQFLASLEAEGRELFLKNEMGKLQDEIARLQNETVAGYQKLIATMQKSQEGLQAKYDLAIEQRDEYIFEYCRARNLSTHSSRECIRQLNEKIEEIDKL